MNDSVPPGWTDKQQLIQEATAVKLAAERAATALAKARQDVRSRHSKLDAESLEAIQAAVQAARPDPPAVPGATELAVALVRLSRLEAAAKPLTPLLVKGLPILTQDLSTVGPLTGRLRRWLAPDKATHSAEDAWSRISQTATWARRNAALSKLNQVTDVQPPTIGEAWSKFVAAARQHYELLAKTIDPAASGISSATTTPGWDQTKIAELRITAAHFNTRLRNYQSFGAQFAAAQQRVVLGDELGLGKSVQALALLSHLWALGARHFLIVAPESTLTNWQCQAATHTKLPVSRLPDTNLASALGAWQLLGGIALAPLTALPKLAQHPRFQLTALVVDKAHQLADLNSENAQAVTALAAFSEHLLVLTSAPGVGPALANLLQVPYLRRRVEDVLIELPERQHIDVWVDFTTTDQAHYNMAVSLGHFSQLRRAGFAAKEPRASAKLVRLLEIANEARLSGRKVVVFSYYLSVANRIHQALSEQNFHVLGLLTGAMPPAQRQVLAAQFREHPEPVVLVAQLQPDAARLDLKTDCIAVLAEPQLSPAWEEQAISQVHGHGQLNPVQLHRLLATDSIDESLLELLSRTPPGAAAAGTGAAQARALVAAERTRSAKRTTRRG